MEQVTVVLLQFQLLTVSAMLLLALIFIGYQTYIIWKLKWRLHAQVCSEPLCKDAGHAMPKQTQDYVHEIKDK